MPKLLESLIVTAIRRPSGTESVVYAFELEASGVLRLQRVTVAARKSTRAKRWSTGDVWVRGEPSLSSMKKPSIPKDVSTEVRGKLHKLVRVA